MMIINPSSDPLKPRFYAYLHLIAEGTYDSR